MTSKEVIQELYNEREYLLGEKVNNKTKNWHNDIKHYDNINHCLLTIREDLDQLEKLTKVIDILKEVLKRGFIFKFGENIDNGGYISITKIDCNNTTIVNIRKEEYDLLKEVLQK